MRFSVLLGIPFLSLAFAVVAEPHGHNHGRRHHEMAKRASAEVELHKRFDNARFTFYDVGLGACGQTNVASDFIVALNTPQYGSGYPGPDCFKTITITANGKTTTATIMDECPGCPYGGLDMSRGLFSFFADQSVGVIYGTWNFADGSGGGGDPSTSSKYTPPPTTSKSKSTSVWTPPTTSHTPTSTWSPPPSTSKASTSSTPKTTSTSKSSSSSSSPTTSYDYTSGGLAVPTGTIEASPSNPENLNAINQIIIGVGAIVAAGAQAA